MHDRATQAVVVWQVNAMHEEPVISAQLPQTGDRFSIVNPFGNVHVDTDTMVLGQLCSSCQAVVTASESRVDANHSTSASCQKAIVLGQSPSSAIGSIAIGDAITSIYANADFGARVCDHR